MDSTSLAFAAHLAEVDYLPVNVSFQIMEPDFLQYKSIQTVKIPHCQENQHAYEKVFSVPLFNTYI